MDVKHELEDAVEHVRGVRAEYGGRIVTWLKTHGRMLAGIAIAALALAFFATMVSNGRKHAPLPKTIVKTEVITKHVKVPVPVPVEVHNHDELVQVRGVPTDLLLADDEPTPAPPPPTKKAKKGKKDRATKYVQAVTPIPQEPLPKVEFTCEQVRDAVKQYGVKQMFAYARQYNISAEQIRQAKRCMGWRK